MFLKWKEAVASSCGSSLDPKIETSDSLDLETENSEYRVMTTVAITYFSSLPEHDDVTALMRFCALLWDDFDRATCCKMCRRSFESTPNVMKKDPEAGDMLKRRRPGGLDCSACSNLPVSESPFDSPQDRDRQLATKEGHVKWMGACLKVEQQRRSKGRVHLTKRAAGETSMQAFKQTQLEFKKQVGTFWPAAAWHSAGQGNRIQMISSIGR